MPLRLGVAALAFVAWIASAPKVSGATPLAAEDPELLPLARRGLNLLMDGDCDGAIEVFHQISIRDPQSALGYLLEGDATWWRIYYLTGDLVDPDIFEVARAETTPYDAHFEDFVNVAISKSATQIYNHQDEARNYLYLGLAYGLRARLAGLRGKDLATARAGKKMRAFLLKALELDPTITDAYLGVGMYNYFEDTLPAIVKILRIFIALPGGSRELGLEQLQKAAQQGDLIRGEAKFYLAKDFSRRNEMQYARSLELLEEMRRDYPNNPVWALLAGSLHCRLEHWHQCEELYRQVYVRTGGERAESKRAAHQAARTALQRMHPKEKIGD